MINCVNQIRRVEMLRESLEQSLKNCSKFNSTTNDTFVDSQKHENVDAASYGSYSGSNINTSQRRPLCLLFRSNTAAVIQISVNIF